MDYEALRDSVEEMLQEAGSVTVLRRLVSGGVPDPITGVVGTPTYQSVDVSLVVTPLGSAVNRRLDAESAARAGMRQCVFTCREFRPRAGDQLWLEGAWRPLAVPEPLSPDMVTDILYTAAVVL